MKDINFCIKDLHEEKSFSSIAEEILQNHVLLINGNIIQLMDIEFYYFSDSHKDGFTLAESKKPKGTFRPHRFGLDIALGNCKAYGGILLKGCYADGKYIYKSNKVAKMILNYLKFGNNDIRFIERRNNAKFFKTKRSNLGNVDFSKYRTEEFRNRQYRFILNNNDYYKAITENKTEIVSYSNLNDEEKNFFRGW